MEKRKSIKKIIQFIKKTSLYVLIGFLLILVILGYMTDVFKEKESEEILPQINPSFEEIPTPKINSLNNLTWSSYVSVNFPATLPEFEKTKEVYKVASVSAKGIPKEYAVEFANRLEVAAEAKDMKDAYIFETAEAFLRVLKSDLSWQYKKEILEKTALSPVGKEGAQARLIKFLKDKGFYKEILNEALVQIEFLQDTGFVLQQTATEDTADFYGFNFHLNLGNLPIVSKPEQEALIQATVSKYGEIFTVDYSLGEVLYDKSGLYPVRNLSAALEDLKKGKGIIVGASEPPYESFSGVGEIIAFQPSKIELLYYQDFAQGFMQPIIQFEGNAKLKKGNYVNLKVWLPGISTEWLK